MFRPLLLHVYSSHATVCGTHRKSPWITDPHTWTGNSHVLNALHVLVFPIPPVDPGKVVNWYSLRETTLKGNEISLVERDVMSSNKKSSYTKGMDSSFSRERSLVEHYVMPSNKRSSCTKGVDSFLSPPVLMHGELICITLRLCKKTSKKILENNSLDINSYLENYIT